MSDFPAPTDPAVEPAVGPAVDPAVDPAVHPAAGPGTGPAVDPVRRQRIRAASKAWTNQLVDLGGRNTLLHYRDLKQGTLDLETAEPVAVDSLLVGDTVRLSPLPGPALAVPAAGRNPGQAT